MVAGCSLHTTVTDLLSIALSVYVFLLSFALILSLTLSLTLDLTPQSETANSALQKVAK